VAMSAAGAGDRPSSAALAVRCRRCAGPGSYDPLGFLAQAVAAARLCPPESLRGPAEEP
ncbi:hypothetical protein HispidOSU_022287, partial [Sigmodon hispidus]